MRPMSAIGSRSINEYIFAAAVASRTFSACVYAAIRVIQVRSAPAQNAGPAPASTTALTSSSSAIVSAQTVSSAITVSLNALRTSGRLSVRYSTGPSRRMSRNWKGIVLNHDGTKISKDTKEKTVFVFFVGFRGLRGYYIRNTPNFGAGIGAL